MDATTTTTSIALVAQSSSPFLYANLLAAMNATLMVISFIVAYFYGMRYYKGKLEGYARTITLGISLSAFGLGLHRSYWAIQRFFEGQESTVDTSILMNTSLAWITLFPLALIMIGYGFHLSPYLRNAFKTTWVGIYTVAVCIVFLFFLSIL